MAISVCPQTFALLAAIYKSLPGLVPVCENSKINLSCVLTRFNRCWFPRVRTELGPFFQKSSRGGAEVDRVDYCGGI